MGFMKFGIDRVVDIVIVYHNKDLLRSFIPKTWPTGVHFACWISTHSSHRCSPHRSLIHIWRSLPWRDLADT